MKRWQKSFLCATFLAAAVGGTIASEDLQLKGDLKSGGTYAVDLKRNPVVDNFSGKTFVYSTVTDIGTGTAQDAFLNRNAPAGADPWVRVPTEVTNLRLETKVGPFTVKSEAVLKEKATPVICGPKGC